MGYTFAVRLQKANSFAWTESPVQVFAQSRRRTSTGGRDSFPRRREGPVAHRLKPAGGATPPRPLFDPAVRLVDSARFVAVRFGELELVAIRPVRADAIPDARIGFGLLRS